MNAPRSFIIIDDDKFVITYCRMLINKTFPGADIKSFTEPETGLYFLQTEFVIEEHEAVVILFLDLNMSTMSGWEFLEEFEKLDDKVKNRILVYILSSSVDDRDKEKGVLNKEVVDYIVKPLSKEVLCLIDEYWLAEKSSV